MKKNNKKVKLEVKSDNVVKEAIIEKVFEEKPKLGLFSADFGREDLNSLRNKVNEIVDFLNK